MSAPTFHRELGRLEDVRIEIDDHGILVLTGRVDFGGSSQGLGGFMLDHEEGGKRVGRASGLTFIRALLDAFRCSTLKGLHGRTVYALKARDGFNDPIVGLEVPAFDGGGRVVFGDFR